MYCATNVTIDANDVKNIRSILIVFSPMKLHANIYKTTIIIGRVLFLMSNKNFIACARQYEYSANCTACATIHIETTSQDSSSIAEYVLEN